MARRSCYRASPAFKDRRMELTNVNSTRRCTREPPTCKRTAFNKSVDIYYSHGYPNVSRIFIDEKERDGERARGGEENLLLIIKRALKEEIPPRAKLVRKWREATAGGALFVASTRTIRHVYACRWIPGCSLPEALIAQQPRAASKSLTYAVGIAN